MLKDITLGQYYSADSVIHRLDPRVKIRFVILYILMSLIDRNVYLFGLLTILFFAIISVSKVEVKTILKGTRGLFIFILFCSALNIFTTPGEALYHIGTLNVTLEGIVKFGFVFWRMFLIIIMSSMLMYTTTPSELTDGLEKCFHLSGGVAMGITIALRFVSIFADELDRILKAQCARGVDFKSGSVKVRIKKVGNVIIPLFQNAIHRAGNLGDAMDARCYTGGKGRTKLKTLKYDKRDIFCYIFTVAIVFFSILLAVKF